MERGTPFAAAHTFGQTGPFRPRNMWGENVVFAGSGTHPGVGVPMVLLSGRLAAERIVGPDRAYRSHGPPMTRPALTHGHNWGAGVRHHSLSGFARSSRHLTHRLCS